MSLEGKASSSQPTNSFQHWDDANWAQVERSRSEQRRADCAMGQADAAVRKIARERRRVQLNSERELEQRMSRLAFWRCEIEKSLAECRTTEQRLLAEQSALQTAIADLREPHAVNSDCRAKRQHRLSEDFVNDAVDRRLAAEQNALKDCQTELESQLDAITEQIRLTRKNINKLDKDLKFKDDSVSVERECLDETRSNQNLTRDKLCDEQTKNSYIESFNFRTTGEWERKNAAELERAGKQREASSLGLARASQSRRAVRETVTRHLTATDAALASRVSESADAKHTLADQLAQTHEQIARVERKLSEVSSSRESQSPQKLRAETRVVARTELRGKRERCFDTVHASLLDELGSLESSRLKLESVERDLRTQLANLRERAHDLSERLTVKSQSESIDEGYCVDRRKALKLQNFIP